MVDTYIVYYCMTEVPKYIRAHLHILQSNRRGAGRVPRLHARKIRMRLLLAEGIKVSCMLDRYYCMSASTLRCSLQVGRVDLLVTSKYTHGDIYRSSPNAPIH
jgi:hypothetical protein